MPKLSTASQTRLNGAHPSLKKLFTAVAETENIIILDGQRGREAQEKAYSQGHSRAHFGQSAHNWNPALALDVCPYPIDWNDIPRFVALSKVVKAKAKELGISITYGGGWKKIKDYPHYELTDWKAISQTKVVRPYQG